VYILLDICYIRLEDGPYDPKHVAFTHGIVLQLSAVVLAVFLLVDSEHLFGLQEEL
jgi:hypothetical protein